MLKFIFPRLVKGKCVHFLKKQFHGKQQVYYRSTSSTDSTDESMVVDLPQLGKVRGKRQFGIYGDEFFSFEGLPFAKPPIDELRFKAPQVCDGWGWDQELDARKERDIPVQVDQRTSCVIGSEDCLYLNVYTKHFDRTKPSLPVMVFIYGGAFRSGGASRFNYGPDYLMSKDIVYVVFNYRVCSLGFLSLPNNDLNIAGDAGLQDQVLALRWIKQHIEHFNGDANNITLFGQSAGAASVHFMMCMPEAKDLFHKAIMMSGSMLCPWTQSPGKDVLFCQLAVQAGYEGPMTQEDILKFLHCVSAEKLVQHDFFNFSHKCFGFIHPFVPSMEERPLLELMREAWSVQVPLLLGGTSFEGLVSYPLCKSSNGYIMDLLKQEPTLVLPYELYKTLSPEERECRAATIVETHYGPRSIDKNNVSQVLDLFSYKLFWHGLHRVVRSRLVHAQAPTYLYRFDFDSPTHNFMRIKLCGDDIKRGVCHADDLGYIFHKQNVKKLSRNSPEYCTIQRMVSILTTFASTGDPNCEETGSEAWTPLTPKLPYRVLNIGQDLELKTQCERQGLEVWNQLYDSDKALYGG
ncbi:esterase B1 [Drosophila willistoni]|nr:esterase B1 [Drosophila willistoni]